MGVIRRRICGIDRHTQLTRQGCSEDRATKKMVDKWSEKLDKLSLYQLVKLQQQLQEEVNKITNIILRKVSMETRTEGGKGEAEVSSQPEADPVSKDDDDGECLCPECAECVHNEPEPVSAHPEQCVICLGEEGTLHSLECGCSAKYHDECIQQYYQRC